MLDYLRESSFVRGEGQVGMKNLERRKIFGNVLDISWSLDKG